MVQKSVSRLRLPTHGRGHWLLLGKAGVPLFLWIGDGDGTGHSALTPEPLEPNAVCSGESQAHLRLSQPQDAVVACAPRISGPESE